MCVQLLKFGLIALTGGIVFPSAAVRSQNVFIKPPFQQLPYKENESLVSLLESSQILKNGIETRIQDLSEVYQIPMKIIRLLERLSRLQSGGPGLNGFQGQITALRDISTFPQSDEIGSGGKDKANPLA